MHLELQTKKKELEAVKRVARRWQPIEKDVLITHKETAAHIREKKLRKRESAHSRPDKRASSELL